MVFVLRDWRVFRDNLRKWGHPAEMAYQIDHLFSEKAVRVRILEAGGRYALDLTLKEVEPKLEEIQMFLDEAGAKRIVDVKDTAAFFS